jgi:hypothetical protein
MVRAVDAALPVSFDAVSLDYRVRKFLRGHALSPERAHYYWRTVFADDAKRRLVRPEWREQLVAADPFLVFEKYHADVADCHPLDQALYVDIKTWLVDDILVKVDRATMAHSLEARAPFLDHRLVEFAASLPPEWKLKGMRKKHLLKRSQRRHLPPRSSTAASTASTRRSRSGSRAGWPTWPGPRTHDDALGPLVRPPRDRRAVAGAQHEVGGQRAEAVRPGVPRAVAAAGAVSRDATMASTERGSPGFDAAGVPGVVTRHPDLWAILLIVAVAVLIRVAFAGERPAVHRSGRRGLLSAGPRPDRRVAVPAGPAADAGVPFFIAAVIGLFGEDLQRLMWVQHVVVGPPSAALTYVLGRLLTGRLVALVAGLLIAVSGPLLLYEHYLLTDAPFTLLLLLTLVVVLWAARRASLGWAAFGGLLFGVTILCRPAGQVLAPVLGIVLLLGPGRFGDGLAAAVLCGGWRRW